ncbi:MAG TPA: helix-turn-helix transcriptional regulator, partial [Thermoanaerobaculia bacterium]
GLMSSETRNMTAVLRTVMQVLGLRQAQIERTLGWHASALGRVLTGRAELRFEHIVDIGRAMGLKPQEVFRFAYPAWGEPPSEAGRRVREITGSFAPQPAAPPAPQPEARLGEQEVERMVLRIMRRMFAERLEQALGPTVAGPTAGA